MFETRNIFITYTLEDDQTDTRKFSLCGHKALHNFSVNICPGGPGGWGGSSVCHPVNIFFFLLQNKPGKASWLDTNKSFNQDWTLVMSA